MLFACAEALHAHGYSNEASRLTVELAQDLLANPPDLKVEPPPAKVREPSFLFFPRPTSLLLFPTPSEPPPTSTEVNQTHLCNLCTSHLGQEKQGIHKPSDLGGYQHSYQGSFPVDSAK